jgi:putative endonuclease
MSTTENLYNKAVDAAVAFLERSNMPVLAKEYETKKGTIPLIAIDGKTLVHVTVKVSDSSDFKFKPIPESTIDRDMKQIIEYQTVVGSEEMDVRIDSIELLVISDDRALLRHHRDIGGNRNA